VIKLTAFVKKVYYQPGEIIKLKNIKTGNCLFNHLPVIKIFDKKMDVNQIKNENDHL